MIYLYDNAICNDLRKSFNVENNPGIVSVVGPEDVISIAAQLQNDQISFPIIALTRNSTLTVDNSRMNFTRLHRGIPTVIDKETNKMYYERVIPIELEYDLDILATRIADMDEIVKELLFKYHNMYFLTFELPYEAKRLIRFGVRVNPNASIERKSGVSQYLQGGTLHQTTIPLVCEGCVEVSYTPVLLERKVEDKIVIDNN